MPNPIPAFDHNLVLPPHLGDPTNPGELSPYPCTTLDLCQRFGTSPERRAILQGLLNFRDRLRSEGLTNGFQWLDGSFLEDTETREGRAPKDLDLVTVYWGYDPDFQTRLASKFPAFANRSLSKGTYGLDHYNLDAGFSPAMVLDVTRYWILLFSHNRQGIWKGMLRIELDTPAEDVGARQELVRTTP